MARAQGRELGGVIWQFLRGRIGSPLRLPPSARRSNFARRARNMGLLSA